MKKPPLENLETRWLTSSIIFLLCATAALLLLQHFFLERVFLIDGNQELEISTYDDRTLGGESVGNTTIVNSNIYLDCDYKRSYQWPFCGFSVRLGFEPNGIDLSSFDTVELDIETDGPDDSAVRVHIRNFNPAYSKVGDVATLKRNEILYTPNLQPIPFSIELKNFRVASWWVKANNVSPQLSSVELSNAVLLDVTTSDDLKQGKHTIVVRAIRFKGKWVTLNQMLLFVLSLWVTAAAFYLYHTFRRTQSLIKGYSKHAKELESVNTALKIERKELKQLASQDAVTKVRNRIGLRDHLYKIITTSAERDPELTIIFIDIDHFKHVNDRYGHSFGDEVLKEFAQYVNQSTGPDDFFGRWGGEEFILLLHKIPVKDAVTIAEALRNNIKQKQWPKDVILTCSFGIAARKPHENMSDFIQRADNALRDAKSSGGDCVATNNG